MCVCHARQFLSDVAAVHQHGNFFEQALAIELVAGRGDQPLREPLLVALFDFRPQLGHAFHGLGQAIERGMEDGLERLRLRGRA